MMKSPLKNLCLATIGCAAFASTILTNPVAAAPVGLAGFRQYWGLTITGAVGTAVGIQCSSISPSGPWVALTNLTLPTSPYQYIDLISPPSAVRYYTLTVTRVVPPNMVFVPGGTFVMGSSVTEPGHQVDEWPQTTVTILRGFFIGRCEVTQGEYLALMGANPSYFTGDLNRPVEQVTWRDATNYCHRLTQREAQAGRLTPGWIYRLPREAEWDMACRAGTLTRFSFGNDPAGTALGAHAWYYPNSGAATHSIGNKLPNPWGLHDVHGNVWEFCLDYYGAYPGGSVTDPVGPTSGVNRVIRGGAYSTQDSFCRSAARGTTSEFIGNRVLGFRVVLAEAQP